jgi:hypothetical protein
MTDPIARLLADLDATGAPDFAWIVEWSAGGQDPVTAAWARSQDPEAMLALLFKIGLDHRTAVRVAIAAARTALRYVTPGEPRAKAALDLAARYADGAKIDRSEIKAAVDAAFRGRPRVNRRTNAGRSESHASASAANAANASIPTSKYPYHGNVMTAVRNAMHAAAAHHTAAPYGDPDWKDEHARAGKRVATAMRRVVSAPTLAYVLSRSL